MGDLLYCRPTDIVTAQATLSLTLGTANSSYPLTNLVDGNPAKPFKTTGTSCNIRFTFGAPVILRAISFGPHNLAGGSAAVSLSNNGGMGSTAIPIPSNREDGLSVNPFLAFASSLASQWDLQIASAPANIAIGELQLIVQMRTLEILLGAQEAEQHKTITHETDHGVKMKYWLGVSQRRLHGSVLLKNDIATLLSLVRSAQGQYKGLVLVPDSLVNDALFVDLATDERVTTWLMPNSELAQVDLDFLEIQRGLAL